MTKAGYSGISLPDDLSFKLEIIGSQLSTVEISRVKVIEHLVDEWFKAHDLPIPQKQEAAANK